MILLIILLQIYSHTAQVIESSPDCENVPNIVYNIDKGVVCVPADLIYREGFDGE